MLRPERMSKVSVTGSKAVMEEVIETVHELNLLHVVDYDDRWEGFRVGDTRPEAEPLSETLVTVRSIESILNIDEEDAGPSRIVTDEEIDAEIEDVRGRVNELDDRRAELREEHRDIDDRLASVRPFARLGIDLDLLSGYNALDTAVVEGREDEIEEELSETEGIEEFETFAEDGIVAVFVYPEEGYEDVLADVLVNVEATALSVPEAETSPEEYVADLEARKEEIDAKLDEVEADIEELKLDAAGFLLAVEEQLSIDVQKAEIPLSFATTEHSFIAEGWVLSEQYSEFESALAESVGERVVVDELERVTHDGHAEPVAESDSSDRGETEQAPAEKPAATDGGEEVRADGGQETTMHEEKPPVVLDNPGAAKPFELLVNLVNRPKYTELDPTLLVFLTYPLAFGFMIGDIGYGLLYIAMGAFLLRFDSEAMKALGWIGVWAGISTAIFGYLYDDLFGAHMADMGIYLPLAGLFDKGLQTTQWAELWIIVSILFGLLHLNIGLVIGFINEMGHGLKAAIYERGSWILAMNGLFAWIFSLHLAGSKPGLLVGSESALNEFIGFGGLPEIVGIAGLVAFVIGVVMVGIGEGIAGVFETPAWAFGHVLSYLRMVAVLLAKGGMAFAVNLIVFGGYSTEEGYTYFRLPGTDVSSYTQDFPGLVWIGVDSGSLLILVVAILAAVAVFVLGHILVLILGITAAGIQMLRLEYVEFFQKFYEGGGEEYEPFGYDRSHTSE